MTQTSNPQEENPDNNEFISGVMLKHLIMAGALWSQKHFSELAIVDRSSAKQINDILRAACYRVSKCSSDSVKDILIAAQQGAHRTITFHQGRPFLYSFVALATALSDKQEISAQDLAQAMHIAVDNVDRVQDRFNWVENLLNLKDKSAPRRAADVAGQAATTMKDIYRVLDEVLEEIEHSIVDQKQKQKRERNTRRREAIKLTISTALGLKIFFEGMQRYFKGQIHLNYIQEEIDNIEYCEVKIASLYANQEKAREMVYDASELLEQMVYDASELLEEIVSIEISDPEVRKNVKMVKELVHSCPAESFSSIHKMVIELLDKLLPEYAPQVYAYGSSHLAREIDRGLYRKRME